jgi:hypothetical protein
MLEKQHSICLLFHGIVIILSLFKVSARKLLSFISCKYARPTSKRKLKNNYLIVFSYLNTYDVVIISFEDL